MTRLEVQTASAGAGGLRHLDMRLLAVGHARPPLAPRLASRLVRALDTVLLWHERARQRRQLLQLNDAMLRDIGLGRADALGEAAKPFWRG